MDLNQHYVLTNRQFERFESVLPVLSVVAVAGTISGVIFTVYYLFIKFNLLFTVLYVITFVIGMITWTFVEVTMKKIESITKQNAKEIR